MKWGGEAGSLLSEKSQQTSGELAGGGLPGGFHRMEVLTKQASRLTDRGKHRRTPAFQLLCGSVLLFLDLSLWSLTSQSTGGHGTSNYLHDWLMVIKCHCCNLENFIIIFISQPFWAAHRNTVTHWLALLPYSKSVPSSGELLQVFSVLAQVSSHCRKTCQDNLIALIAQEKRDYLSQWFYSQSKYKILTLPLWCNTLVDKVFFPTLELNVFAVTVLMFWKRTW